MIKLAEVRKIFNQGRPNETVALRGINLEIQEAKLTVLKGPSGSGKTTLLSLIGCMTRPTSGRIWLCERELTSLPEKFLTTIRKETFGFVFQQFNLIGGISVLENVTLPAYPIGMPRKQRRERAIELLDRFSIANKAHVKVESLSGGEAQRVAIARALMNDPKVMIADEPTAQLDSALSKEFMAIMAQLKAEGKTILIASHDPLVWGSPCVDRVVEMRDGTILMLWDSALASGGGS